MPEATALVTLLSMVLAHRADVERLLAQLLGAGRSEVVVGIGDDVDIKLLDDDLLAAHMDTFARSVHVVTLRWTAEGYMLSRGYSSIGVFWTSKAMPADWGAVPRNGAVRGLRPGDLVSLGSIPADGIRFLLPPPPSGTVESRMDANPWLWEHRIRIALLHWRYKDITIAATGDPLVLLDDPSLKGMVLMLSRDVSDPGAGLTLRVLGDGPGVALERLDSWATKQIPVGSTVQLPRVGNRLVLGEHKIVLPSPAPITPRFKNRIPQVADWMDVFGLNAGEIADAKRVKARHRELVRALHPDRTQNKPGPTSRFLEVQACWESWEKAFKQHKNGK